MQHEHGGLYITGGSANFNALAAGSQITTWTDEIAPTAHGNLAVVADATTGKLTLQPGVYKVDLDLTIEGNYSSGTSGDFAGVVIAALFSGGTLVTGTKSKVQAITEGLPMNVHVSAIVEITLASQQAATPTNYITAALYGGDASGNDVVITEGRLLAHRIG